MSRFARQRRSIVAGRRVGQGGRRRGARHPVRSRRPTSPVGSSSAHRPRGAIATTIRGPASGPTESEGGERRLSGIGSVGRYSPGVQDRCMAPRRRDGCPMPVVGAPGMTGIFFCVRRIEWGRARPTAVSLRFGSDRVVMMGLRAPHVPRHLSREEEGMRDGQSWTWSPRT